MNFTFSDNVRKLFILQCTKSPEKLLDCLKWVETRVVLIVGVLCDVCAYVVAVSDRHSTLIRYQKNYMLVSDRR